MATASEIQKYYSQYLGFSPDSKSLSSMAMMSPAEVEDTLKNTKTEVQSSATQTAQSAISSLMSPGGEMLPPAVGDYLTQMAQGREMLADRYGLTEAEKRMREAEQFYQSIAQKGPMLGQTMAGGLMEMSPTFLGATRKDLEGKFADIENPFVRDSMIDSYLRAADRSMTATLNALNGLYQTSLMSAQTAMESEQRNYLGIADKVKSLYSELQWMNRNRVQEQMSLESYEKKLKIQEQYGGETIEDGPNIDNWAWLYNMGEVNASQIPQEIREQVITKSHELDPLRSARMKAQEAYEGGWTREKFIDTWRTQNQGELDKMTPEERSQAEQQITEVANTIWGEPKGGIIQHIKDRWGEAQRGIEKVRTYFGF